MFLVSVWVGCLEEMCEGFLNHFEVGTMEAEKVGRFDEIVFLCFLFKFEVAFSDGSEVALNR